MVFNKALEDMGPLRTESCLMEAEAMSPRDRLWLSRLTGPVNRAKPGTLRGAEPGLPGPTPWTPYDVGASTAAAGANQHQRGG